MYKKRKWNKKGGFTDLFLFMIISLIIVLISGVFIYMGLLVTDKLHESMDDMTFGSTNTSEVIDDNMGDVNDAYGGLYWISIFLIVGMMLSIFIGSYLVTTKPIFFVPYIFITIIAIIVSVGISNAYEQIILNPTMASTFMNFTGANWILLHLPTWITAIGFVGGIIMFSRMGKREETMYGY